MALYPRGDDDPVFRKARRNSTIGRGHRQTIDVIAYYEKHEGTPFRLRLSYRTFGAISYAFDRDIKVTNGDWQAADQSTIVTPARPEDLRRSVPGTVVCGEVRPLDEESTVGTAISLSPSDEKTKAEIPEPIDMDFNMIPASYHCPCPRC